MTVFRYGDNLSIELQFAEDARWGEFGIPSRQPLGDLSAATRAVLEEPLDYPSLSRCTTPADRVVVALDRAVPDAAAVTAAVVQALVDAGVDPDGIAILQTAPEPGVEPDGPCRMIPAALRERVTLLTHDPTDRRQLAYLAANEAGEAILINRALHDADVVLPVGCLYAEAAAGYFGIHGSVFPAFSDAKTIQRFRGFGTLDGYGDKKRDLTAEVEHVAWLLGLNFTIQLVPGPGGHALEVLAGQSESVQRHGRESYRAVWSWPENGRASLVVAAIEGDATQQTWENLGRALESAEHFVEEDGAIAICCELAASPGPGLRHIAQAASRRSGLRHVSKQRPADALPAAQVAQILDHHKLYLLSRLDSAVVEDLDIIPLAAPDELARLVQQHSSCILLSNAPYVTAERNSS